MNIVVIDTNIFISALIKKGTTRRIITQSKLNFLFPVVFPYREQANELIGQIDPNDTLFIATALAFNCPIWSDDIHFKKQNKIKIFTTPDMVNFSK